MASDEERRVGQFDPQNPDYYKRGTYETIEIIAAVTEELKGVEAVLVGNIIKYLSRYRHKNPEPLTDAKKALWYCEKLVSVLSRREDYKEGQENITRLREQMKIPHPIDKERGR